MKKLLINILLVTISVFLIGLLDSCNKPNIPTKQTEFKYSVDSGVEIYTIDGHQYIGSLYGSYRDWATHSGSCPHPDHKNRIDTVYISVPEDTVYCVISPLGSTMIKNPK